MWPCLLLATASSQDPDFGSDVPTIVRARGYQIEQNSVVTDDGYILGLFRVVSPVRASSRPPVLLQHGSMDSSYAWVANYANQSLAFLLVDAGFDVWLPNARGSAWSQAHTRYPPRSAEFWNFTFDEMAAFDLPANVAHVRSQTGAEKVGLVAHSEGATTAFAALSSQPELARQLYAYVALAPPVFMAHISSPVATLAAKLHLIEAERALGVRQLDPPAAQQLIHSIGARSCALVSGLCTDVLSLLCGQSTHLNVTRLPVYLSQTPSGAAATKNMVHWMQGIRARPPAFQRFDYGCGPLRCANELHYGQRTPPSYTLSAYPAALPTSIFHGSADPIANPDDVAGLMAALPATAQIQSRSVPGYAHMDFTWGVDANSLVYPAVLARLSSASGVSA